MGGDINLYKGDIFYFNKTFKIEQASFSFDDDSNSINPVVNIKSFYRTKDTKGESVKITLTLLDKLLSFKTDFSAFPYKTQDEIQGLLGLGVSSVNDFVSNNTFKDKDDLLDKGNQNFDAIINTTNYLSNSFLFSPIENNVKKVTGLDTFSLNTNFFGNILKSNTNLLDVLDDSSLSVGKYVSDQIYLGSLLSFNKKSNQNQQFFLPLEDKNYGLNLQFMLQVELQFLSLGYTFAPMDFTNFLNSEHRVSIETSFKF